VHALRNQFSPCHARVDDSFAGADIQSRKNRAAAVSEFCLFTRFTVEEIKNGAQLNRHDKGAHVQARIRRGFSLRVSGFCTRWKRLQ